MTPEKRGPHRVGLVVIFNHRYDANIPKLRKLYGERFSHVRFLVPGMEGQRDDVIGVLENSDTFHGYLPKAVGAFRAEGYSHYAFVADDLVLARDLDEFTMPDRLRLDDRTAYIKRLTPLCHGSYRWVRTCNDTLARLNGSPGLDRYARLLPTPGEFGERLARHGLDVTRRHFSLRNLLDHSSVNEGGRFGVYPGVLRDGATLAPPLAALQKLANGPAFLARPARAILRKRQSPLPLASGYSDFVVVPSSALEAFVRLCDIFAAMRIWVEVAIPTALALSVERISTEDSTGCRGREIWNAAELSSFETQCARNVNQIPSEHLYVHPVKLSRWTVS